MHFISLQVHFQLKYHFGSFRGISKIYLEIVFMKERKVSPYIRGI